MKNWHFVAILILLLSVGSFISTPEVFVSGRYFLASVLPSTVVDYANNDRQGIHRHELRENILLSQAASLKAHDMASRGYFSHVGPAGETPWTWLDKVGYKYVYAGENLAVNYFDSEDVHRAWMNSPIHRDNLLDERFTEIGVGVAQGKFNGRDSLYIVEFLGTTEEPLSPNTDLARESKNLMATLSVVANSIISLNRHFVSPLLELSGYQTDGKVI